MTTARIFLPREMVTGRHVQLRGEDRRYVLSVRRMRTGDTLRLFDGEGSEYEALILGHDQENVTLEILRTEPVRTAAVRITLAQSLPKAKKMDFIIEKACELGVTKIVPFVSHRSVPHIEPNRAVNRRSRWQKIALEAARQSQASAIPEVTDILAFDRMVQSAQEDDVKIIFWEEERRQNLREFLTMNEASAGEHFFLVIGPEGGFTKDEIDLAGNKGFTSLTLGPQILKVETAALAILTIMQYERGIFKTDGQRGGNQ